MPVVNRQGRDGNRGAVGKVIPGTFESRIRPVSEGKFGIKMNIYGRGKTGKTRLACTFPKPLLILGTERGTESVKDVKEVYFIGLQRSDDVLKAIPVIRSLNFKTVVLDTAGGFQDLILKEVLNLDELPVQKTWGMARREDWMAIGAQWKERIKSLLDLANTDGRDIVIIAHERNFKEDGETDTILPSVGAALTPTTANWLNGECDYVCQTFIREQEKVIRLNVAGQIVEERQKTGGVEYCLRVGPHSVYMTGFRLPTDRILPDVIVNPSYQKIMDIIEGKKGVIKK